MVFVDSDLIIGALRKNSNDKNIQARLVLKELFAKPPVKITIFNHGELFEGTYLTSNVAKSQRIMAIFLKKFEIVPFLLENSLIFARISAELQKKGKFIGDLDILIASIVIGNNDVLYTHNIDHFKRVPDLKIIDWMEIKTK